MSITSKAGAIPKEMMSASESNSRPNIESCPFKRAIRPSSASNRQAPRMRKIAMWNSLAPPASLCIPSKIAITALKPQARLPAVMRFGRR